MVLAGGTLTAHQLKWPPLGNATFGQCAPVQVVQAHPVAHASTGPEPAYSRACTGSPALTLPGGQPRAGDNDLPLTLEVSYGTFCDIGMDGIAHTTCAMPDRIRP